MKNLFIPTIAAVALSAATSQAAITITNGDFETGDYTGWTVSAVQQFEDTDTAIAGGSPNTMARFSSNNPQSIYQSTSHNWAATDQYTLSILVTDASWRIGSTGDRLRVELYEVGVGGTIGDILWDSGDISADGTVQSDGGSGYEWTSGAPVNTFNISAADFSTGTEGSELGLRVIKDNSTIVFFDDISLTAVPEPSSTALIGLAGLGFILRRRR